MQDSITSVQRVVAEVAAEYWLSLAADKAESMVIRGGYGRKKNTKNGIAEKVKWLGVILDIKATIAIKVVPNIRG